VFRASGTLMVKAHSEKLVHEYQVWQKTLPREWFENQNCGFGPMKRHSGVFHSVSGWDSRFVDQLEVYLSFQLRRLLESEELVEQVPSIARMLLGKNCSLENPGTCPSEDAIDAAAFFAEDF